MYLRSKAGGILAHLLFLSHHIADHSLNLLLYWRSERVLPCSTERYLLVDALSKPIENQALVDRSLFIDFWVFRESDFVAIPAWYFIRIGVVISSSKERKLEVSINE